MLNDIVTKLPPLFLMLGDLNGHRVWGCRDNNRGGGVIEEFVNANNLNILNNGSYTFSKPNIESAIDLSICSPVLIIDSQWSVLQTHRDSYHNSVLV